MIIRIRRKYANILETNMSSSNPEETPAPAPAQPSEVSLSPQQIGQLAGEMLRQIRSDTLPDAPAVKTEPAPTTDPAPASPALSEKQRLNNMPIDTARKHHAGQPLATVVSDLSQRVLKGPVSEEDLAHLRRLLRALTRKAGPDPWWDSHLAAIAFPAEAT